MNDNENKYTTLKAQCQDTVYQFTKPSGYDKTKWPQAPDTVKCPHWILSEEYALTQKDFSQFWHTPGVRDGGIEVDIKVDTDGTLKIQSIQDGFISMGTLDTFSMKLERNRNRMIEISVDANTRSSLGRDGSGRITVSTYDDPEYILWQVQYFNYIANEEQFVVVKARSKNEAKVIAWHDSCYCYRNAINPDTFKVWEYSGPRIISRDPKFSDEEMKKQMIICEEYDKEYGE